ncbi:hypothetical protein H4582DRAFT_2058359 [Lactarius indigo]|nr:hypothetical protein H4582DRAFT_2058359 [Lactarius indigo]
MSRLLPIRGCKPSFRREGNTRGKLREYEVIVDEAHRTCENIRRPETYKPLWGGSKNSGMVERKVPEAERGTRERYRRSDLRRNESAISKSRGQPQQRETLVYDLLVPETLTISRHPNGDDGNALPHT